MKRNGLSFSLGRTQQYQIGSIHGLYPYRSLDSVIHMMAAGKPQHTKCIAHKYFSTKTYNEMNIEKYKYFSTKTYKEIPIAKI